MARVVPPLRVTAGVALGLALLCLALWRVAGGSPEWPAWTALGLALPVGVQASYAARALAPSPRAARLVPAAGLCLLSILICIGAWAIPGGGFFWPAWVILGNAVGFALRAVGELGAESERRVLTPRLEQLARTRAGVVDARDDELRRIERDLHDGAQARLVSVTMSLGLAEDRLERDPEGARELVMEAQQQARTAIKELRDLARGIAPPVLADRGLRAAVEALTMTSALPVEVAGEVGPRPPASVERAGYFVVAEALANAGKHAGATAVHVSFARWPDRLVVTVADDGRGGAHTGGSGLAGLRGRVEGVDGRLEVLSPPGEGTTIRATLPCASS
jgi:signal transduction histidine kinase